MLRVIYQLISSSIRILTHNSTSVIIPTHSQSTASFLPRPPPVLKWSMVDIERPVDALRRDALRAGCDPYFRGFGAPLNPKRSLFILFNCPTFHSFSSVIAFPRVCRLRRMFFFFFITVLYITIFISQVHLYPSLIPDYWALLSTVNVTFAFSSFFLGRWIH